MKNKFSQRDWEQRLEGTICRVNGRAAYIRVSPSEGKIFYQTSDDKEIRLLLPEDNFDVSAVPIGYVMYSDKVLFVRRSNRRSYKQGLSRGNINVYNISGQSVRIPEGLTQSKELLRAIDGEFKTKLPQRSVKNTEIATSRDTAILYNDVGIGTVYFRTDPVGWVAPKESKAHVVSHEFRDYIISLLTEQGWSVSNV